jgi:hypothetical protein
VRVRLGLIQNGRDIFLLIWEIKAIGSRRALKRDKPIEQTLNLVSILLDQQGLVLPLALSDVDREHLLLLLPTEHPLLLR